MSAKLLVLNLPPNLSHDMFISAFADFRGFLNGSLHLNPQNELYGIVEFSSFEFADIARKVRSGFKFMNSRVPINIEFFKPPPDSFGYHPASNQGPSISSYGNPSSSNLGYNQPQMSNFPNQNPLKIDHPPSEYYPQNQPSRSTDLEDSPPLNRMIGRTNQGIFIPQQQPNYQQQQQRTHYSQENPIPGADIYSGPSQNPPVNYNVYQQQGAPNQFLPQQGIAQGVQNIKGNLQSPNLHVGSNFPTSPINLTANQNIQRGFPNPSNISNLPKPQPQTMGPNYGYVPPNQQNINRQGSFGPSPQTAQNFAQQKGDMRNMPNLVNKVGSPNFPQRPLDMKDEDVAMFQVPPKATCSIYVDGVPSDASEREVSHVFRPFPGYIEVRLIKKETKGGRSYTLCFVDFENPLQSTIALHTLQGYRFDKNDKVGLKISFAYHSHEPPSSQNAPKLKITKRKEF